MLPAAVPTMMPRAAMPAAVLLERTALPLTVIVPLPKTPISTSSETVADPPLRFMTPTPWSPYHQVADREIAGAGAGGEDVERAPGHVEQAARSGATPRSDGSPPAMGSGLLMVKSPAVIFSVPLLPDSPVPTSTRRAFSPDWSIVTVCPPGAAMMAL